MYIVLYIMGRCTKGHFCTKGRFYTHKLLHGLNFFLLTIISFYSPAKMTVRAKSSNYKVSLRSKMSSFIFDRFSYIVYIFLKTVSITIQNLLIFVAKLKPFSFSTSKDGSSKPIVLKFEPFKK